MVGAESKVSVGSEEGSDDAGSVEGLEILEEDVVVELEGAQVLQIPAPVARSLLVGTLNDSVLSGSRCKAAITGESSLRGGGQM